MNLRRDCCLRIKLCMYKLKLLSFRNILLVICLLPISIRAQKTPELVQRFQLCKALAEQGSVNPQARLGAYYFSGLGVDRDVAMAAYWWRKAAEQGSRGAQYGLGLCYANGEGVTKDDAQAVVWYLKAADQGDAAAQCQLGLHYGYGRGVEEDDKKSAYWFQQAAEQGYSQAQLFLSVHCLLGRGVKKDEAEAYAWVKLAAATNEEARTELKRMEQEIKPEVLMRGRQRSLILQAQIDASKAARMKK